MDNINDNDNDNENDDSNNNNTNTTSSNNSSPVFQGMVRMASRRVRNIHHHHHFRVGSESTRTISENEINSAAERDYNVDPPIVGSSDGPILLIHHDHYHIYVDREMNQDNGEDNDDEEKEEEEEDIQINEEEEEEEEEIEEHDEDFQDEVDEDFEAAGVEDDNEMHDQDDDGEPIDEDIEIQHGQNEEELVFEEDFYFEEEEDDQDEVAIELDQEAEAEEEEQQDNEDLEIDIGEEEIEVEDEPIEEDEEEEDDGPAEEEDQDQDDNIEIDDEYDGFDETFYRYHGAEGDNSSSNDDDEEEESNARIILRRSIFSRRGELSNHFPIVNYNVELSEILRQRDNQLSPNPQPFTSSSSGNRYSRNNQFEYQHLFDHPVTESYGCIGWFIYHKFQKSRLFRVESSSKFLSQLLSFYQILLEKQATAQTYENQEKIKFFISCFISMPEIKTLLETSRLSTKELIPIKFTLDIIEHHYRLNDFPLFDHYRNHVLPVSELFYSKFTNEKLTIINKRLVQALSSISNYQDIISIHDKKSQYFDYFRKQLWSIRNQSDLNDLSFYYQ